MADIYLDSGLSFAERLYFSTLQAERELGKRVDNPRNRLFEIRKNLEENIAVKGIIPEQAIREYIGSLKRESYTLPNESLEKNGIDCAGETTLFLSLAEMLDYKLFEECYIGKITRSDMRHVLIRKKSGDYYENIDFGITKPDSFYKEKTGQIPETQEKKMIIAINLFNCGFAFEENHEKAIAYFDKVLSLDPENIGALHCKAIRLSESDMYNEAVECCNKALEIYPDNEDTIYLRNLISIY